MKKKYIIFIAIAIVLCFIFGTVALSSKLAGAQNTEPDTETSFSETESTKTSESEKEETESIKPSETESETVTNVTPSETESETATAEPTESETATEVPTETESESQTPEPSESEPVTPPASEKPSEKPSEEPSESESVAPPASEEPEVPDEPSEPDTPTYTYKDLNKTMWAKSSVNLRDLPSTDGKKVGSLVKDDEVKVTGQCNETKWYRIEYNGSVAYVSNNYLTDTKPKEETTTPTTPSEPDEPQGSWVPAIVREVYTASDKMGDGLDSYRVGLHKYTEDGKYPCYVLMEIDYKGDTNTPAGKYYGYFKHNEDYRTVAHTWDVTAEHEEKADKCRYALRDSMPLTLSRGAQIEALYSHSRFVFFYEYAPNGEMITSLSDNLAIDDFRMVQRYITGYKKEGQTDDGFYIRDEPVSEKQAASEAGIDYNHYLECKKIALSYGYTSKV